MIDSTSSFRNRTPRFRDRMPQIRATLAIAGFLAVAVLAASTANALQIEDRGTAGLDGKIVMSPAAERIETVTADGGEQVGPGMTVKRPVILHNRTKDPVTFDLTVNSVVGSSAELVVDVLPTGEIKGAAAWATLEKPMLTLKPGQQGTLMVTVKIPKDVKPGSKPFAITATQRASATSETSTQGAGIAPQFKQVAIFIVELPGDAPVEGTFTKASITSDQKRLDAARHGRKEPVNSRLYVSPHWADKHRLTLTTVYRNTGERLLQPHGQIVVKDIFGRVAGRYPIDEFTAYPDGYASQITQLKGLPSLGIFQAKVTVESEAGGTQSSTLPRFALVPKWLLLALAAFALYGGWRLLRWRLRRRREWKAYMDESDSAEHGPDHDYSDDGGDWDADDDDSYFERA